MIGTDGMDVLERDQTKESGESEEDCSQNEEECCESEDESNQNEEECSESEKENSQNEEECSSESAKEGSQKEEESSESEKENSQNEEECRSESAKKDSQKEEESNSESAEEGSQKEEESSKSEKGNSQNEEECSSESAKEGSEKEEESSEDEIDEMRDKEIRWYTPLYKAAVEGDWEAAKEFIKTNPDAICAKISNHSDTVLHVAIEAGQTKFVKELLNLMSPEMLEVQNESGKTALISAALSGDVDIAKALVTKNPNLTQIRNTDNDTPIYIAVRVGNKDCLWYLCEVTKDEDPSPFRGDDGVGLLKYAIIDGFYVVPVRVEQASTPHQDKKEDIENQPPKSADRSHKPIVQHNLGGTLFLQVPSIKHIYNTKLMHTQCHELLKCICGLLTRLDKNSEILDLLGDTVLTAAKFGTAEVIALCVQSYPQVVWQVRNDNHSMLHIAVKHRRVKIFRQLQEYGSRTKQLAVMWEKSTGNNILHQVAKLAPYHILNSVSGAALQMQRELQWYKEVEKIVMPRYRQDENNKKKTPRELFTEEHKKLVKDGERWMKDTASSCMVVAALIATVVFAAAFTVPGGNNNDGIPFFLKKKSFIVFAIADALALFSSSTSVLVFLSILTSRYAEEDFLESLPRKLIVGLSTLFFSIATMMIAFCATLFIMLSHQLAWGSILIALLASLPVTFFVSSHFRLLVEMINSTYRSDIFQ